LFLDLAQVLMPEDARREKKRARGWGRREMREGHRGWRTASCCRSVCSSALLPAPFRPRNRGLHSFPFPLNLSLLCPFPLNLLKLALSPQMI